LVTVKAGHGIVYGIHQMNCEQVSEFITWLIRKGYIIGTVLNKYQPGSCEFNAYWMDVMEDMVDFQELQNKFMGKYI